MDVEVIEDGTGSMWGFRPCTANAVDWFNDNVHSEPWQWGTVLYVDHRVAASLVGFIQAAGLEIER